MTISLKHSPNFPRFLFVLLALALIWLVFTLSSCSCDYHARKVKKKCGTITDTLVLKDTTFITEVSTDTVFKHSVRRDTLVLKQDKLLVKYFYNSHDSTVYIQGKCLTDTIIKVLRIPYEKTVVTVDYFPTWIKWAIGLLIAAGIVFRIVQRR